MQELAAPKSAKPTRIKALTKLERNALYLNTIYKSPKPVMMAHVWLVKLCSFLFWVFFSFF